MRDLTPEESPGPNSRKAWALLLAIILLGAGLRLTGITWSLPTEGHIGTYCADEWRAVRMGADLELLQADVTPMNLGRPYFNWGTVHVYSIAMACTLADAVGWIETAGDELAWDLRTMRRAVVLGRLVSAAYGLAAVLAVYLLATRIHGQRAGLLAALLQAISPLEVVSGHLATVNVSAAACSLVAVALVVRAVELATPRAFAAAGAMIGVALAAKLSSLPLVPLVCVAILWTSLAGSSTREWKQRFARLLVTTVGSAALAFAIASPAAILHPARYLYQAHEQLIVVPARGAGLAFAGTGNGFVFLWLKTLPTVLGWPLYLIVLAGLAWTVTQVVRGVRGGRWREPSPATIGSCVCLAYAFLVLTPLGLSETRFSRYLLGVTPMLYVFAAGFVVHGLAQVRAPLARTTRVLVALAIGYTLLYASAHTATLRRPDPRDVALEWFEENVPDGSSVALLAWPTHLVPPIHPFGGNFFERVSPQDARAGLAPRDLRWTVCNFSARKLLQTSPDYVVYNLEEIASYLRMHAEGPERIMAMLERDYVDAAGPWSNDVSLFGIPFGNGPDEMRGWGAATTEVRILRRRR